MFMWTLHIYVYKVMRIPSRRSLFEIIFKSNTLFTYFELLYMLLDFN
jgi:hypothetical protein